MCQSRADITALAPSRCSSPADPVASSRSSPEYPMRVKDVVSVAVYWKIVNHVQELCCYTRIRSVEAPRDDASRVHA